MRSTEPAPFSPEWYADPAAWSGPCRAERAAARVFNALVESIAFLLHAH